MKKANESNFLCKEYQHEACDDPSTKTKSQEICIICQIYLDFHPRNEEPSCLKGACGCVNTNIFGKCLSNIF